MRSEERSPKEYISPFPLFKVCGAIHNWVHLVKAGTDSRGEGSAAVNQRHASKSGEQHWGD